MEYPILVGGPGNHYDIQSLSNLRKRIRKLELISENDKFNEILNEDFLKKTWEEKKALFSSLPQLAALGFEIEDIENLMKSFKQLDIENINEIIKDGINWITNNQKESGDWDILSKEELIKFIGPNKLYNVGKEYFSNAWSNSIINLTLIKWYNMDNKHNEISEGLLERAGKWFYSNLNKENGMVGWGRITPDIDNSINIYDTCFSLITIMKYPKKYQQYDLIEDIIDTVLNSDFYYNSGWSPQRKGELDVGSTSYAVSALMKYSRLYPESRHKKERLEKAILDGVNWLLQNQSYEGGWAAGARNKQPSLINRTCYALRTLIAFKEYQSSSSIADIDNKIRTGIDFLRAELALSPLPNREGWVWSWPDMDYKQPDRENTSIAISLLLRWGLPYYNSDIESAILGLLRLSGLLVSKPEVLDQRKVSVQDIYVSCTLLDYLKTKIEQK